MRSTPPTLDSLPWKPSRSLDSRRRYARHVKLLAGHPVGMADHYVKRNPKMVATCCAAIEQHYFGGRAHRRGFGQAVTYVHKEVYALSAPDAATAMCPLNASVVSCVVVESY